jgi:hypothetical protein
MLNKVIKAGPADQKLKARLADLGSSVFVGSPSDLAVARGGARLTFRWSALVQVFGCRQRRSHDAL